MRGYSYPTLVKKKCINLRKRGHSLNELVKILKIPKTTIYDWVSNKINLSLKAKHRIQRRIIVGRKLGNINSRRIIAKIIYKPKSWTPGLISIIAHFIFDGYPTSKKDGYIYCSKNLSQILRLNKLMKILFGIKACISIDNNSVIKSGFYSVKLVKYISESKEKLLEYLPKALIEEKRAFLKAFFDDEGCVTFNKNAKKVRGYQHSKRILKLVKNLLRDFKINSYIDKRNTEITISRKNNLIKFHKEINFSPKIFINPKRKNGLWKYKIDKRTILEKAISSYQI